MLRRVIISIALTLVRCLRLPLLLGVDVAIGEATSTPRFDVRTLG